MAEFEYFPEHIRKTVLEHITPDEKIEMCFIAGSSISFSKDFVIITSKRVMVVDERTMGYLGKLYVNIKENVLIEDIESIKIYKSPINRLFRQASIGLKVDRYEYLINNGSAGEINKAVKLINEIRQKLVKN
ncbi:TPA: hypothetical protein ENX78_20470 [Candidatus Poribacteria bacterium]|nr:hypothetical protein [Candidatus Poribacteria bacterium]